MELFMVKVQTLHLNSYFLRFGIGKTTSSQSAPKASKVQQNSPTKKSADSKRKKLIQRNYSTKSLMGGLSFGRYWPNLPIYYVCFFLQRPHSKLHTYSISLKLLWHDKDMKTFIENFYRLMGGNSGKDDSQVCSRDTSAEGQCSERPGNVHGMRKCETVNAFSGLSSNRYVICETAFICKIY